MPYISCPGVVPSGGVLSTRRRSNFTRLSPSADRLWPCRRPEMPDVTDLVPGAKTPHAVIPRRAPKRVVHMGRCMHPAGLEPENVGVVTCGAGRRRRRQRAAPQAFRIRIVRNSCCREQDLVLSRGSLRFSHTHTQLSQVIYCRAIVIDRCLGLVHCWGGSLSHSRRFDFDTDSQHRNDSLGKPTKIVSVASHCLTGAGADLSCSCTRGCDRDHWPAMPHQPQNVSSALMASGGGCGGKSSAPLR